MMKTDFSRYSCQIALPGFSEKTQQLLQNGRVLIVGAGGLGCPAALYLAAAGIGSICIADDDVVSIGNLHRQVLYNPADAGRNKAEVACERLAQQNPAINLTFFPNRVTTKNVMDLVRRCDIVVDGTDNFETRYLLNDAAVLAGKPLVYGAIYQFEGQVAVWNVENLNGSRTPNYRDIFPEVDAMKIPGCSEGGVIPTLAGMIGCMQANEVIKFITGTGDLLAGKMLVLDAQTMATLTIKIGEKSRVNIKKLQETIHVPTISAADLKKGIAENSVRLIDVRTDAERQAFNIGGEHLPFDQFDYQNENLPKGIKTIFYCASGKRSAEAVKTVLAKYPGASVYSLKDGLREWQ